MKTQTKNQNSGWAGQSAAKAASRLSEQDRKAE
jgi:hypothetical protein